jgi:tetratricopeptide (TPR) repeat protein
MADELRKEKRYAKAIPLYKELMEFSTIKPDDYKWVMWGYAFCLQKSGAYSEAIEVCRKYYMKKL